MNIKMEIRNRTKISFQHLAIAGQPDPLAVVVDVVMNEPPETGQSCWFRQAI